MKIFSTKQIYDADKVTIENQQIKSEELMERAGTQVFDWLNARLKGSQKKIHVFCGLGNNGGDGLVVARHLQEHGYVVLIYIVQYSEKYSQDFLINLDRLKARNIAPIILDANADYPNIENEDIIVDALFGIGLNRDPTEWVKKLITYVNRTKAFIVSIDMPSGLFMDRVPTATTVIIKANVVLSFQNPKLSFFLPQTGIYAEQWEVVDIGLDTEYLTTTETDYEFVGKNDVLPFYLPRKLFSHKGTYGHALIIGGSFGKIGAVILAAEACLMSGSGLVTAFLPSCGVIPIQTALPEIMVITDGNDNTISGIVFDILPSAIGIGVGMGKEQLTQKAFAAFLKVNNAPLVIDADGLNILSEQPDLLQALPPRTILTPHPKELERLIGKWTDDFDKLQKAKAFSVQHNCILIIKGAYSVTIFENKGYINSTGNPGMATAGSGDVLTGIITGLIAQGYGPLKAAIFGVYLHGRAGDIAVQEFGYQSLTARRISHFLGAAYLDLFQDIEDVGD